MRVRVTRFEGSHDRVYWVLINEMIEIQCIGHTHVNMTGKHPMDLPFAVTERMIYRETRSEIPPPRLCPSWQLQRIDSRVEFMPEGLAKALEGLGAP